MQNNRSIFGHLLLIAAGVVWLLVKSDYIPSENLWALTHIWPYLLIVAGAGLILRSYWQYASIVIDVLIIGGILLAIVFAPAMGWANPSLIGTFRSNGFYIGPGESGSGNVVEETRDVKSFDSIRIEFPAEVSISQGDHESLTIKAEDNFLPGLKTVVRSGTLEIYYDTGKEEHVNPTETVKIEIVVTGLKQVDFESAGRLTLTRIESNSLDVSVSGAGELKIVDLAADDLSVNMSGAGSMSATGSADNLDLSISGFGSFNGEDLHSHNANVTLSGAGSATVWVDKLLDAEISGAGSIDYYGSANVTRQISGLGSVTHKGDK